MADIKKLKIEKKLYRFEVKKRYQYVGRYRPKERKQLDRIKDSIKQMLSRPKEGPKAAAIAQKEERPAQPGINPLIIAGALMLLMLLAIGGWFYITIQLQGFGAGAVTPPVKADVAFSVEKTGIITAGQRTADTNVGFIRANYVTQGITNYTINLTVYSVKLPSEVFMLKSGRQQASGYEEFTRTFTRELAKKRIEVNEITFEEIESLPGGAVVVAPTGFMPQEMLGVGSRITLRNFMEKGNVLVYIGLPFDRMLNGSTVVPTPKAVRDNVSVDFDEGTQAVSKDGLRLFEPRYTAISNLNYTTIYGAVSVMRAGSGALLMVPQTLDGGWVDEERKSSPQMAGEDIARIVLETKWANAEGDARTYRLGADRKENQTETKVKQDFFTGPIKGTDKSVKIEFTGISEDGRTVELVKVVSMEKTSRGAIYTEESTIIPKVITEKNTIFNARLSEEKAQDKKLSFIIRRNGDQVGDAVDMGVENVQAADITKGMPIDLDTGEYIASVVDDDRHIYAEGYIKVVFLDIKFQGQPEKGKYTFVLEKDGKKADKIRNVEVTVENGKYGTYKLENTNEITLDLLQATGGEDLALGRDYTFRFKFGNIRKDMTIPKPKPPPPLPPELILVTVFALGTMAVGILFTRKPEEIYSIDIPDFPPVAKTKITLGKDIVLSLFQKINEDYRWKATPLAVSEVKNGFKRVFYQGKPIFITDYNVEYILNDLIRRGEVKEYLEYYCLHRWEEETKHSAKYLTTFRKLRDIFVNNALPFTALDETEDCDTKITLVGQDMFVHIYDKGGNIAVSVKRLLGSIKKGINILLFTDSTEKRGFFDLLASPTQAMLTLKLEVEAGNVQLLTIEEFEKMLADFKSV